jgi:exodeoxyribonuclease VII small subunit
MASFEDDLRKLEEIVDTLEGGDLSLDDSLTAFGEGIALARTCSAYLAAAEKSIGQLTENEPVLLTPAALPAPVLVPAPRSTPGSSRNPK